MSLSLNYNQSPIKIKKKLGVNFQNLFLKNTNTVLKCAWLITNVSSNETQDNNYNYEEVSETISITATRAQQKKRWAIRKKRRYIVLIGERDTFVQAGIPLTCQVLQ